ncbi:MAG: DUF3078 domain-containing protein [Bacteroidota bacterium]
MKSAITIFLAFVCFSMSLQAQTEEAKAKAIRDAAMKADTGWAHGGSIGFDLSGMGLFNPKQGAGGNRFGIGMVTNLSANYKARKSFWSNLLEVRLGAQKVTITDLTTTPATSRKDFVKNLDLLRLNSRFGYLIAGDKLFAAIDAVAETFLMPLYPGNTIQPVKSGDETLAKFLNPLTVDLSPGIAYNPNGHWAFFASPASTRYIVVADQRIADKYLHISKEALTGDNYFLGLGAKLRAGYVGKFLKDHIAVNSNLSLFSNYLNHPENIDVLWTNNVDIQIFKGLSLGLLGELFYDNDVSVQIDRNKNGIYGEQNPATGLNEFAPAASITGSFMLKYTRTF